MSNLMKFMMTVIALALFSFLNTAPRPEARGEVRRSHVISPETKLPV